MRKETPEHPPADQVGSTIVTFGKYALSGFTYEQLARADKEYCGYISRHGTTHFALWYRDFRRQEFHRPLARSHGESYGRVNEEDSGDEHGVPTANEWATCSNGQPSTTAAMNNDPALRTLPDVVHPSTTTTTAASKEKLTYEEWDWRDCPVDKYRAFYQRAKLLAARRNRGEQIHNTDFLRVFPSLLSEEERHARVSTHYDFTAADSLERGTQQQHPTQEQMQAMLDEDDEYEAALVTSLPAYQQYTGITTTTTTTTTARVEATVEGKDNETTTVRKEPSARSPSLQQRPYSSSVSVEEMMLVAESEKDDEANISNLLPSSQSSGTEKAGVGHSSQLSASLLHNGGNGVIALMSPQSFVHVPSSLSQQSLQREKSVTEHKESSHLSRSKLSSALFAYSPHVPRPAVLVKGEGGTEGGESQTVRYEDMEDIDEDADADLVAQLPSSQQISSDLMNDNSQVDSLTQPASLSLSQLPTQLYTSSTPSVGNTTTTTTVETVLGKRKEADTERTDAADTKRAIKQEEGDSEGRRSRQSSATIPYGLSRPSSPRSYVPSAELVLGDADEEEEMDLIAQLPSFKQSPPRFDTVAVSASSTTVIAPSVPRVYLPAPPSPFSSSPSRTVNFTSSSSSGVLSTVPLVSSTTMLNSSAFGTPSQLSADSAVPRMPAKYALNFSQLSITSSLPSSATSNSSHQTPDTQRFAPAGFSSPTVHIAHRQDQQQQQQQSSFMVQRSTVQSEPFPAPLNPSHTTSLTAEELALGLIDEDEDSQLIARLPRSQSKAVSEDMLLVPEDEDLVRSLPTI